MAPRTGNATAKKVQSELRGHEGDRREMTRKYFSNERIDEALRRIYAEHPGSKTHPGVTAFAQRIGWPKWALLKQARILGLARTKEKPWSDAELMIVERFAYLSDERIRLKLKTSGFTRTACGIHLKIKRSRFKQNSEHYTARGLALAFGIDSHCISRWIREGKLKGQPRQTERTESQGGDIWMIHERDVRKFVRENPLGFDIRKVDQLWFMELVNLEAQAEMVGLEESGCQT
jgi:hypothetical protein